jgi:hypothetical protein
MLFPKMLMAAAGAAVLAVTLDLGLATSAEVGGRYYSCWTEWRMERIGPIKTRVPRVVCGWRDSSGR